MLIKRFDYNYNFTSSSSPNAESSSSTPNSLVEIMKEYAIVEELEIVYSSLIVDSIGRPTSKIEAI